MCNLLIGEYKKRGMLCQHDSGIPADIVYSMVTARFTTGHVTRLIDCVVSRELKELRVHDAQRGMNLPCSIPRVRYIVPSDSEYYSFFNSLFVAFSFSFAFATTSPVPLDSVEPAALVSLPALSDVDGFFPP